MHEARFFHQIAASLGNKLRDGERGSPGNVGGHLEAVHPVIRTNPVTGWKSVFVNPNFTKRIVGVTKDESDTILKHLFSLIQLNHDLQVRFKWEKVRRGRMKYAEGRLIMCAELDRDLGQQVQLPHCHLRLRQGEACRQPCCFFGTSSRLTMGFAESADTMLLQGEKPYFDPTSKSRRQALGL